METRNNIPVFGAAIPVGSTIKDMLADKGYSQKEFAKEMGIQPSHFNELINGKRKVTPEIAMCLEKLLGIKATTWLNMQAQYDCNLLALQERNIKEQEAFDILQTYNTVIDWRLIVKRKCKELRNHSYTSIVEFLQRTLHLQTPAELQLTAKGLFRKSTKTGLDTRMLMTWIVLARLEAQQEKITHQFDSAKQSELTQNLVRILHENADTINRVKEMLNRYGIGFSIVEKVDKASVDGFSYWEQGVPMIVISKRYDKIDNLAFTIMHELGHIFLHPQSDMYVQVEDYETEAKVLDIEADKFANDALIPSIIWRTLPQMCISSSSLIQNKCFKWAEQHALNKWIVLGRVSFETGMYKFRQDETRKIL